MRQLRTGGCRWRSKSGSPVKTIGRAGDCTRRQFRLPWRRRLYTSRYSISVLPERYTGTAHGRRYFLAVRTSCSPGGKLKTAKDEPSLWLGLSNEVKQATRSHAILIEESGAVIFVAKVGRVVTESGSP